MYSITKILSISGFIFCLGQPAMSQSNGLADLSGSGETPSARALAIVGERLENLEQMLETSKKVIEGHGARRGEIEELMSQIQPGEPHMMEQLQLSNVISVSTLNMINDLSTLVASNTVAALKTSKAEAELLKLQLESADYELKVKK
jgi:hypothetical protein